MMNRPMRPGMNLPGRGRPGQPTLGQTTVQPPAGVQIGPPKLNLPPAGKMDMTQVLPERPMMTTYGPESLNNPSAPVPTKGAMNPMMMKKGGAVKKMAKGGKVSSASKRADGCAIRGKTKGRII